MDNAPKVILSNGYLEALVALPKEAQGKALECVNKFRNDPQLPGLNLEHINTWFDPKIFSLRVNQNYRIILHKDGDYCTLLYVDKHDAAYSWAERRTAAVNEKTGDFQLYVVKEQDVELSSPLSKPTEALFGAYTDEQLTAIGLPPRQLPMVRNFFSADDFHASRQDFPDGAYEALDWLVSGRSYDEVVKELNEIASVNDKPARTIEESLKQAQTQRSFYVPQSEEELSQAHLAPLEAWRVFLHPSQRILVTRKTKGPVRVTGGAGTGKTVVAMHRARKLAADLIEQGRTDEKILFTTFTTNLVTDIRQNLKKICTREELLHIEVDNLDRWVGEYLKNNRYEYRIVYGDELDAAWQEVVGLSGDDTFDAQFCKEEWSKVVCANAAYTKEAYLRASRSGRGTPLDRKQKFKVWEIFEEYKDYMDRKGMRDAEMAMDECCALLQEHHESGLYSSVVVDEGQDFSASAWRLLRAIAGDERQDDLFIVADAHQRIYQHKVVLSRCGVNVRGKRSAILRINYRTTEETRNFAMSVLKGCVFDDLDGSIDKEECRSLTHGLVPYVRQFSNFEAEVNWIAGTIRSLTDTVMNNICIVLRTNKQCAEYKKKLEAAGIACFEVKRSSSDDPMKIGVRIATLHRVKGLEFEYVFIAGASDDKLPHENALKNKEGLALEESITAERCLLYVALTRAKKRAYVTSNGKLSRFVKANYQETSEVRA
ncbi:MAG: ATP-dependent helicase [Pyramidobacter sp.]|nr:ATP-dependent helicase [Pyramidobacter sp.]